MTDLTPDVARILQYRAVAFSKFINSTYDPVSEEAVDWRRIMKVATEAAEALEAYANSIGENFRKGECNTRDDVVGELMDTAFAALCAAEHLTGHHGKAITRLLAKAEAVMVRAGLDPMPPPADTAPTFPNRLSCPDNGKCHHGCLSGTCYRVHFCGPLTGHFPGDVWPQDVADFYGTPQ